MTEDTETRREFFSRNLEGVANMKLLSLLSIRKTALLAACLLASALLAEETWQQRRDAIELQIDQETQAEVEAQVTRDLVILDLQLTPPFVPTRSVESIIQEGEARISAAVKQLQETSTQEIYKRAEEYFPYFQVGDTITVPALRPDEPDITGILVKYDKNTLLIGRTHVRRSDLSERYRNCVDAEWVREQRDRYVQTRLTGLQQKRELMIEAMRQKYIVDEIRAAGYVPARPAAEAEEEENEDGKATQAPIVWTTGEQLIQQVLAERRQALFERLRPTVEKRLFTENGFKFYKTENCWLPVKGEGSPSLWTKFRNRKD